MTKWPWRLMDLVLSKPQWGIPHLDLEGSVIKQHLSVSPLKGLSDGKHQDNLLHPDLVPAAFS